MSLARANAARWHVDVHRLGVLGFSSGGALAALLSFGRWPESDRTVADEARSSLPAAIGEVTALDDALDAATRENRPINRPINRPAFTLLLYPSGFNSSEFARSWHMPTFDSHGELGALQPAVRPPPTFIAVAQDDDVVGVEGSVALWASLRRSSAAAVGATGPSSSSNNHALHVFSRGGHGFGVCLPSDDGEEAAFSTTCAPPTGCHGIDACSWLALARAWLQEIGML